MRTIPSALQEKLESGATTLARCWIVTRNDGLTQGFTEHDEDIVLGGVTCLAGCGLSGSEAVARLGLAVDGSEMSGALSSETLNEDDLAAGHYDAAGVDLWLVDWSEPELRVLLAKGVLGEVKREGVAFVAELRGLSQKLAEESGRLFTSTCSADLGDARCTVDLTGAAYRGSGTVATLTGVSGFTATGLDAFDDGWFAAGKLNFTSGGNAGLAVEVKLHKKSDSIVSFALWQAMAQPIAAGDTFVVTAGCDKKFATCRDRFTNAVNFRGFPHIPGNDFVISYPVPGVTKNDGSRHVVGV